MARYIADVRFIASIYPGPLPVLRRYYGPSINAEGRGAERSTLFRLEPVPRGGRPFLLPVHDSFEEVLDVMALSAFKDNPRKPRQSKPVPVESIIADLLNDWTGRMAGVPAGAKPGVGEVQLLDSQVKEYQRTGKLPEGKLSGVPQEEYDGLVAQQTLYFEFLFQEGERLHKQNNWKEITDTMRLAAEWLGHQREWSHKAIARDSAPCPWCTSIIPNAAIVCPTCGKPVKMPTDELAKIERAHSQLTQR